MRIGYADPPYVGQSKKHYEDHPDYAGEVDHPALIERLCDEYDAAVLHLHTPSLRDLLPLCPPDARVLSWVKPFAVFKKNVPVAYAWEPVIVWGRRPRPPERETVRDWIAVPITLKKGVAGAKPEAVCHWIFEVLGAEPTDELDDMFPGSGAVAAAWESWCRQPALPFRPGADDDLQVQMEAA